MQNAAPALFASRWDSVRKSGEVLDFQVPFIGAARADGLDISPDILYQPFAAEIRVTEKFFAQVNCHCHVDFVLVFVLQFSRNLNFPAYPGTKIMVLGNL